LTAGDPVATGLVDSLARPGGNVTGLSDVATELSAKRLELLNEIVPQLRIVGILWNANDLSMTLRSQASEVGARSVGVTVQQLALREMGDFEAAFEKIRRAPPDALLVVDDIFTQQNRSRVFDFAVMQRLPAIYEYDLWVRGGGLMSYGPDLDEVYERGSGIADSILKGARPADLPIEQPTRFRFLINLKTAKALGLTVPASLLARADEVIE
jgi:putative ABC transport system substrate-binding protein